ncbi:MAG TPA: DUF748 domain-containing protein, partial [Ohtaekwangia sp.]|nr:DUF748 domain-containing protein [Ohtaekwangia sp.]
LGVDTVANAIGTLRVDNLGMERIGDSLAWRESDLLLSNMAIRLPKELYAFKVKSLKLGLADKVFEMDSMAIIPTVSRRNFMKQYGKEIDYIKGIIPYIRISGLTLRGKPLLTINAEKISLNLRLEVYRDKRWPFIKDYYTALPIHSLQRLPIHLKIDTIQLSDSFVSYEEFPEKGDSAGGVFFDKLNATIASINNDPAFQQASNMKASAQLMGKGDLVVNFTFPYDTLQAYGVSGSLQNFPLVKLNSMLGPAAKARIESGVMTNLKFNYRYNPTRADGEVELNYENLKVLSLRENNKNEASVDVLKTLLVSALIRKDMDETVREDKKTGTVLFYRDTKRSVLNYWWKSLFSGIKSAYNIDKLQERFAPKNGKKKTDRTKKRRNSEKK